MQPGNRAASKERAITMLHGKEPAISAYVAAISKKVKGFQSLFFCFSDMALQIHSKLFEYLEILARAISNTLILLIIGGSF
jgi:hypothetical protein